MTKVHSPPRIEVVKYVTRTNGDPEPVTIKTKQAKLSDFIDKDEERAEDLMAKYGLPPCLKKDE